MLPTVCILAGGLGTRLGAATKVLPKPLVEIAGEPFLIHQLRLLARHGADHVVLCVGHFGDQIESRIGYRIEGVEVSYSYDAAGLDGTLGAIRRAQSLLGERFLVLYGDTYLQIDYQDFADAWTRSARLGAMSVFHNRGELDRSNVIFRDDQIVVYDKDSSTPEMEWIDYGLGGLEARALHAVGPEVRDLAALYHDLSVRDELFGYEATTRFYEIGTPDSLIETDKMLRSKAVDS